MLTPRNSPAAVAAAALIFGLAAAPSDLRAADESKPTDASASAAAQDASDTTESASNTEEGTDRSAMEGYGGAESGVDGVYGFNDKKLRERGRRAFGMH